MKWYDENKKLLSIRIQWFCRLGTSHRNSCFEPVHRFSGDNFFNRWKTCHLDGKSHVTPDTSIDKFGADDVSLLILPGGEAWEEGKNQEIIPLLQGCLDKGKMVAAICGATAFLGEKGYLDKVKHTSNNLDHFLKQVAPSYKGEKLYQETGATRDKNLITASGAKPLDFAREILTAFDLFTNEELKTWFSYFTWDEEHTLK